MMFGLLCDPHKCPELNTVVLANIQYPVTHWPTLVEKARVRDQNPASSNIYRVDIVCRPEDSSESDELAEMRAHACLVEIKPWNHGTEGLTWLGDRRFRTLHEL